jgi:hypothetical protein
LSEPGIATRIICPSDCLLGFAIPTARERFMRDLASGDDMRFAPSFDSWTRYRYEVVRHLDTLRPALEATGTAVVEDFSLEALEGAFSLRRKSIVVLLSHWCGDRVEFAGGMASADDVVDRVPEDFAGIIDLCVCSVPGLVTALKTRRRCLVRYGEEKATPEHWLYFYLVLFKCLSAGRDTYLTAYERVTREFLR